MSSCHAAGGRYALVVDDNPRAAELAAAVLESDGWTVDRARDGFEAITRFSTRAYDVMLLDFHLPGMDGAEVLGWVRRNVAAPPEVIVLSSACPELLKRKFDGLGVRAILGKPPIPAVLWQALAAA